MFQPNKRHSETNVKKNAAVAVGEAAGPERELGVVAFRKITAALDEEERYTLANLEAAFSVRPFAPEDADVQVLQTVTRAVAEGRVLRFGYSETRPESGGNAGGAAVSCGGAPGADVFARA